jgi:hypothetical protein
MAEQRTSDVTAGPGGVMTDEVGVVTGELTVVTTAADGGGYTVKVQYKDADEWYAMSDIAPVLAGARDLDAAHAAVLEQVAHPPARPEG